MGSSVIDTTVRLSVAQLAGLRSAGVTCVSRYGSPPGGLDKNMDAAEVGRCRAAGMQLVANWEHAADTFATASHDQMRAWAYDWATKLESLGYPKGAWSYQSVDFDVQPSQWTKVADNLLAFRTQLQAAGYDQGVYGSGYCLRRAREDGLAVGFWQAMSTGFRESNRVTFYVHLVQRRSTTIAGVACDINDVLIPRFGQMTPGGTALPTEGDTEMELTTPLLGNTGLPGRPVDAALVDGQNLRNWWYARPGETTVNPPPPGSRADLLEKLLAAPTGGGLSDADRKLLAGVSDQLAALRRMVEGAAAASPAAG